MREYETTFIVQPEISDEGLTAIFERLDGILGSQESIRLMYDDQGRRRLAYEIENFQKGRYVTLMYLDEGKVVSDLERSLRLDDSVLRFLTVQVEDDVLDIEARTLEAAELERVRAQKAAERAAREAEEATRAAEAAAQQATADEAAAEKAATEDAPTGETDSGKETDAGAAATEEPTEAADTDSKADDEAKEA
ncbi:MAG: 30S ribosomal protein S6 [Myxococcales bacterium]|nr:30S ribosomal protein S6 [Myxococcales bacterium]